MQAPLQITFRNLPHSDAIAFEIKRQFAKLQRFSNRIIRCQVVVEIPYHHHREGNSYHIRIKLTMPGEELVVNQDASNRSPENAYIAIRDAFNAARRELKEYSMLQKL